MEVVLLWLDDLDDALFSVALAWERLRRVVLSIGLVSALALAGSELSALATQWAPVFTYVAGASVGAWFVGVALRAFYYRESSRSLTAA
jgi:CHASE2 domain-containing sensor protein